MSDDFSTQIGSQNRAAVAQAQLRGADPVADDNAFTQPTDSHEAVRAATERLVDPDALERAVREQLPAHTDPIKAEMALAYDRVTDFIQWAHHVYEIMRAAFGDKLELPVPPPKPGAGVE